MMADDPFRVWEEQVLGEAESLVEAAERERDRERDLLLPPLPVRSRLEQQALAQCEEWRRIIDRDHQQERAGRVLWVLGVIEGAAFLWLMYVIGSAHLVVDRLISR